MKALRAVGAVAVLSTVFMLGCRSGGEGPPDPFLPGSGVTLPVRLTVQNNDFNDAVVYANWRSGLRHRVGLFTGKASQTLTFPWRDDEVQFEVDFIAGDVIWVDPIVVYPGDHLDLVLQAESSKSGRPAWGGGRFRSSSP